MSKPREVQRRPHSVSWKILETKVKGTAAVQVSVLPLRVPRYSFRVGAAVLDEQSNTMHLSPFVTIFNFEDAADLLRELGKKYSNIREARIDEVEEKKEQWQKANAVDAELLPEE